MFQVEIIYFQRRELVRDFSIQLGGLACLRQGLNREKSHLYQNKMAERFLRKTVQ